jgi:hypothetical protein
VPGFVCLRGRSICWWSRSWCAFKVRIADAWVFAYPPCHRAPPAACGSVRHDTLQRPSCAPTQRPLRGNAHGHSPALKDTTPTCASAPTPASTCPTVAACLSPSFGEPHA